MNEHDSVILSERTVASALHLQASFLLLQDGCSNGQWYIELDFDPSLDIHHLNFDAQHVALLV